MAIALFFICHYILWFLFFSGWGLLLRRAFGTKTLDVEELCIAFWTGWACVIFYLQIEHFFWPVNESSLLTVIVVGIAGLVLNGKALLRVLDLRRRDKILFGLSFLVLTFFIVARAVSLTKLSDNGLYHYPLLEWLTAFPDVPGLGNLHGRLAFTPSYFLYIALLKTWFPAFHYFANSLFMTAALLQLCASFTKLLKRHTTYSRHHYFDTLLMPIVFANVFSIFFRNPSPDFPSYLLGIILSSRLIAFFETKNSDSHQKNYIFLSIVILGVLGIVNKLSFIVLGAGCISLAVFSIKKDRARLEKKTLTWSFAILFIGLLPWVLRSIILTGYIAYPASLGAMPVDWRIPKASVDFMRKGIHDYACLPIAAKKARDIIFQCGPTVWLHRYFATIIRFYSFEVLLPLLITINGLLMILLRHKNNMEEIHEKIGWLLWVTILALGFWFITAPDIRFSGAGFWILAAATLTVCADFSSNAKYGILILAAFFFILGPWEEVWAIAQQNPKLLVINAEGNKNVSFSERDRIEPTTIFKIFTTDSGLKLLVPQNCDRCWDAPIPCTPYPRHSLRLRKIDNLKYGFRMEPFNEKDKEFGFSDPS